jgi:hypothetical protein
MSENRFQEMPELQLTQTDWDYADDAAKQRKGVASLGKDSSLKTELRAAWATISCLERQLRTVFAAPSVNEEMREALRNAQKLIGEMEDHRAGRKFCFPDFNEVTLWLSRARAVLAKADQAGEGGDKND